jgi:hypothetical protein
MHERRSRPFQHAAFFGRGLAGAPDATALQLLKHYVAALDETPTLTADLARLAVSHICDLAALALGATRDAAELANGRGLRAARLRAIKADILARLGAREPLASTNWVNEVSSLSNSLRT